uniref:hypothetical protein n=1 Tax=Paractinoplanes polyasparticus TaxID=2856853 RepID=UPI001C850765|nr:hypothetical protein [Actinoplanes polyasparticus]
MARTGWNEVDPYETVEIADAGVSVYHDGDEETTVWLQADGTLKLGHTSGQWQIRLLREPAQ